MCGATSRKVVLGSVRKQPNKWLSSTVPISALLEFCHDFPQLRTVVRPCKTNKSFLTHVALGQPFITGTKNIHSCMELKVRSPEWDLLC